MNEPRFGGRLTVGVGVLVALTLLMGSGFQSGFSGSPSAGVFQAMGSVVVASLMIGIAIGCYNLGRERGR